MSSATIWVTAAAVVVAGGGALHVLLTDTGVVIIDVQSCNSLGSDGDLTPSRPPDRIFERPLLQGHAVSFEKEPGIWRAVLDPESARIAVRDAERPEPTGWARQVELAWCRSTPELLHVLTTGDGTLHVRMWEGAGDGLRVR